MKKFFEEPEIKIVQFTILTAVNAGDSTYWEADEDELPLLPSRSDS